MQTNLTNAQWYLALLACLVVLAAPSQRREWRVFDLAVIFLSALTGPFALLLTPVAAAMWWLRRHGSQVALVGILAAGTLVQGLALLGSARSARPAALGATPALFVKILARQVFLGALLGRDGLGSTISHPGWELALATLVVIAAVGVLAYALGKAPLELRLFIVFAALILAATLIFPQPRSFPVPQWQALVRASGVRYWLLPMLAFVATMVWMLNAGTAVILRRLAVIGLLVMGVGLVRDWRCPAFPDLNFAAYAERFAEAPSGTRFTIPLNPKGWSMELLKH